MGAKVSLRGCADYNPAGIKRVVQSAVEALGGIGAFVKTGETVLLKPNMLAPASPEKAVTTHPSVIRAVAELVLEAGGKPFIGDSPAVPGFKHLCKATGIAGVAEKLGIPVVELAKSAEYKQGDKKLFRILEISEMAMEADRIINLPKLKTHSQMFLTLGVKNIFGCVVGARKAQWHFKAGMDRMFFARMLVGLYHAVSPDLTILDGVIGMEGDGPGTSGVPRNCGVVAASSDAVALDRVILEILGATPEQMYTIQAARETGVGETDLSKIEISGEPLEFFRVENFAFPPKIGKVPFGPPMVRRFILNHLTAKPKEARDKCTLCNKCVNICPTEVISVKNERLKFDYDKCIRCYCCVEVCPEGAMRPTEPMLLRITG
ncbi:MAG: DUF362 domain-containing protein [Nitrospinae bacterium]|nr:DUF362 domain-containing protein [Nitrospinota bacterium]